MSLATITIPDAWQLVPREKFSQCDIDFGSRHEQRLPEMTEECHLQRLKQKMQRENNNLQRYYSVAAQT